MEVFVVCLLALLVSLTLVSSECFYNAHCKQRNYGTQTGYEFVRGDIRDVHSTLQGECRPIGLWVLSRHGTRYPGNSDVATMKDAAYRLKDSIVDSHAANRGTVCTQDVENLKDWAWDPSIDDYVSQLAEEGYAELFGLGKRLREKFPELISYYNTYDFHFRASEEQRSVDSCSGLIEGMFGENSGVLQDTPSNAVLRPYRNCERWLRDVSNNPNTEHQFNVYLNTSEFTDVMVSIQQRTGLLQPLSSNDVISIGNLCRFEQSWYQDRISPWCALLTPHDLDVLEYAHDLDNYYSSGYGNYMNGLIGALPLRDLLENMEAVRNGQYDRRVVGYCSHNSMMTMVYTALGLFRDSADLTGWNRDPNRSWQSSKCANYANNLIAVMYDCPGNLDDYRVEFYQNENLVNVCSSSYCRWNEFEDVFSQYANANLDFCSQLEDPITNEYSDASVTSRPLSLAVFIVCLINIVLYY